MRDLVGRSSVRNTIFMMRQVEREKTVLIVEGASDSRSFSKVIRTTHCKPFAPGYPGGKEQALALFHDLKQKKLPGVVAIVDPDGDRYYGRTRGHEDICWTSCSDREVMIIQSPAFNKFVAANFTISTDELRKKIMTAAFPLGCLRITSYRAGWGLDFKWISRQAFIDSNTITCNEASCCQEILAKNPRSNLSEEELMREIQTIKATGPKLEDVVTGHDLSDILSLVSGPGLGKTLSHAQIEHELAECFEPSHFSQTSTHEECATWEGRNSPFLINQ